MGLPFASHASMLLPYSVVRSPCFQRTGMRYGCATFGDGRCVIIISRRTSSSGLFSTRYLWSSATHRSYISLNEMLNFFIDLIERAHLLYAVPNATFPLLTSISHSSTISGGALPAIILLTWLIILRNLCCMPLESSFSSLMRRSILLMNRTGFALSLSACLRLVSVWG